VQERLTRTGASSLASPSPGAREGAAEDEGDGESKIEDREGEGEFSLLLRRG
jgi:hypothetical protein